MKTLTLTNAKDLINWFATEGQDNWGVWGNYPNLPVSASYHSFDTCRVRVLFNEFVEFNGLTFNCISTGRAPGKNIDTIGFNDLKAELIKSGVQFSGDGFMTVDYATSLKNADIDYKKQVVNDFQNKYTYEWCLDETAKNVEAFLINVRVNKEFGQRLPETINNYSLTIKNYCEKEEVTILVDLQLTGTNSKKTCGYYKVVSTIDKKKIVEKFAAEKFQSYSKMRIIHENELTKMLA